MLEDSTICKKVSAKQKYHDFSFFVVLSLFPCASAAPRPQEEQEFFESSSLRSAKKVLVYFLGGVTYAEVAAIRFLNTHSKFAGRYKFVIATTSIISSKKCMKQMRTAASNQLNLNSFSPSAK